MVFAALLARAWLKMLRKYLRGQEEDELRSRMHQVSPASGSTTSLHTTRTEHSHRQAVALVDAAPSATTDERAPTACRGSFT